MNNQINFIAYCCYQGKIDVIKLLQQSAKGKEILENFNEREKPFLKDCEREEITRIVVADVVSKIGHLYPSTDTKEHMGASITNAFTCLKINRPGVSNYCHFYNRKTGGFIDTRLKTLRRSQSPSKRKRCSTKKPEKGEDKGSKRKNDVIATVLDESTMFKVVLKLYFVWWFFNHISYFRFVGCNRTHQSHKTELRYFST